MTDSFVTAIKLVSLVRVPGLSEFLPNVVYFIIGIIVLIILINLVRRVFKRRESISSSFLSFEISDDIEIASLINEIHTKQVKIFKEKQIVVIESIVQDKSKQRILKLHKSVYNQLSFPLKRKLKLIKLGKDYKESIDKLVKDKTRYIELETKTDFVLPYLPISFSKNKRDIEGVRFVQICLRPMKDKWKNDLVKLQRGLLKGYDETLRWQGCIGGFVGVLYPFVALREGLKTDETKKVKNYEITLPKTKFVNHKFEEKYNLIENKISSSGFDVSIKLVIESNISVLESVMNLLNTNIEDNSNSFSVSDTKKFSGSLKEKLLKGYLPEHSIDLLNETEISEVINRLII